MYSKCAQDHHDQQRYPTYQTRCKCVERPCREDTIILHKSFSHADLKKKKENPRQNLIGESDLEIYTIHDSFDFNPSSGNDVRPKHR